MQVRAAAKGLVRGPLHITLKDGSVIDCRSHDYLIAQIEEYDSFMLGECDAVLVIEKEAVFQSLTSHAFHDADDFQCLLVTGKGCKNEIHEYDHL